MEESFPICRKGPRVPTEEEEELLKRQKALKEHIRQLKAELVTTQDQARKQEIQAILGSLKEQWDELELRKEEARTRRMRLLGYED
jgi:enoyl-[acyl-carrier-protein] reductase (NADH)